MRGDPKVLAELNAALRDELTSIIQYIVHAEMREDWGYSRLSGEIRKQAIDEMRHAEKLIERILYLEGTPEVNFGIQTNVGANVQAQIENDLAAEREAVQAYNRAVAVSVAAGDNGTRDLFQTLLNDEEQHLDHHKAQINVIEQVGIANFLAQQLGGGSDAGH